MQPGMSKASKLPSSGSSIVKIRLVPTPPIGLDMDGVICTPFLGKNIAISRRLALPPLPGNGTVREFSTEQRRTYLAVRRKVESVRYLGRRPLPGVREGLEALKAVRTPVLITGRSWYAHFLIERWLERYELADYFGEVLPNNTDLSTAQFKLWMARKLGLREYVDDDGSIAYYLANHGLTVFLREWPRNRGLPYPAGVRAIKRLGEVAEALTPPVTLA